MTSKRRLLVGAFLAAIIVAVGIALAVFKPWLLLVNTQINEEIPQAATSASATANTDPNATHSPASETPSGPVVVSQGEFVSHEHTTTGSARIYRLPDGSHQLTLENLNTSNGPDVRVWLSKGPVFEGFDGFFTAGEHPHLDIAPLKGNQGNQVYDLPADFNPNDWTAVDLWCEDFSVSFGAAALTTT